MSEAWRLLNDSFSNPFLNPAPEAGGHLTGRSQRVINRQAFEGAKVHQAYPVEN
jgi:hypothetical protein